MRRRRKPRRPRKKGRSSPKTGRKAPREKKLKQIKPAGLPAGLICVSGQLTGFAAAGREQRDRTGSYFCFADRNSKNSNKLLRSAAGKALNAAHSFFRLSSSRRSEWPRR